MDVFVYREPKGFETRDLEGIEELGEQLTNYGPLTDDTEVKVEITASWRKIKELMSLVEFSLMEQIWFNPNLNRGGIPKGKGKTG